VVPLTGSHAKGKRGRTGKFYRTLLCLGHGRRGEGILNLLGRLDHPQPASLAKRADYSRGKEEKVRTERGEEERKPSASLTDPGVLFWAFERGGEKRLEKRCRWAVVGSERFLTGEGASRITRAEGRERSVVSGATKRLTSGWASIRSGGRRE